MSSLESARRLGNLRHLKHQQPLYPKKMLYENVCYRKFTVYYFSSKQEMKWQKNGNNDFRNCVSYPSDNCPNLAGSLKQ